MMMFISKGLNYSDFYQCINTGVYKYRQKCHTEFSEKYTKCTQNVLIMQVAHFKLMVNLLLD